MLAAQPEWHAARRQDLDPGTADKEFSDSGRGFYHLLEVIQDQEQVPWAQGSGQDIG